ncbi:MAG TPA: PEP-CTERM sorting domain-containing protein [Vicinamibacterales bacterium]|nr:PEP-CTERM sorting domain-containing protein [Vicinamibacterales bacterium]
MRLQFHLSAGLVLMCAVAWSHPAAADTIVITSGSLEVVKFGPRSFEPSPIHLQGGGFTLDAIGVEGRFGPALDCDFGCVPGQLVDLSASWGGLDLIGTATLNGSTYAIGTANSPANAQVDFASAVTLPPIAGPTATMTAPFQFTGMFSFLTEDELVTHALVGSGLVTATFEVVQIPDLEGFRYQPLLTTYEFEPVPEPGTLLLLATGGALAMRRRRRA